MKTNFIRTRDRVTHFTQTPHIFKAIHTVEICNWLSIFLMRLAGSEPFKPPNTYTLGKLSSTEQDFVFQWRQAWMAVVDSVNSLPSLEGVTLGEGYPNTMTVVYRRDLFLPTSFDHSGAENTLQFHVGSVSPQNSRRLPVLRTRMRRILQFYIRNISKTSSKTPLPASLWHNWGYTLMRPSSPPYYHTLPPSHC